MGFTSARLTMTKVEEQGRKMKRRVGLSVDDVSKTVKGISKHRTRMTGEIIGIEVMGIRRVEK